MQTLFCPECGYRMQLIKGDYGVWLEQPYWKCFRCAEEVKFEPDKATEQCRDNLKEQKQGCFF